MRLAKFIFFLMCLEKIAQVAAMEFSPSMNWMNNFILVKPGENLTLTCLYRDEGYTKISWFKQTLEEKPRLISAYRISSQSETFYHDSKNNPRFNLHTHSNGVNLMITDLKLSDSATYYCVNHDLYSFEFTGYNVAVESSELAINQSPSESIPSGGCGTLNCTVHTGTCDRNHTVYWFTNSGPSVLRLEYSHRSSNHQCEKKTNTCFYSLSMKNLNFSQTGTYYCAVAACGHILFGNGTKLEFEAAFTEKENLLLWVYFLSISWMLTIMVVVFLSIYILTTKKRTSHHLLDSQSRFPVGSTANTEGDQEEDNLHYAVVRINQPNRSRTQRNSQNECVYSGVRQ